MPVQRCAINEDIDGHQMTVGYQDILFDENGVEIEVVEEVRHEPIPRYESSVIVEEEPPF